MIHINNYFLNPPNNHGIRCCYHIEKIDEFNKSTKADSFYKKLELSVGYAIVVGLITWLSIRVEAKFNKMKYSILEKL